MNKSAVDVGIGAGAISVPAWLTTATSVGELVVVGLGIGLVSMRLIIAWRELRQSK